jgi:hypothetical protein
MLRRTKNKARTTTSKNDAQSSAATILLAAPGNPADENHRHSAFPGANESVCELSL